MEGKTHSKTLTMMKTSLIYSKALCHNNKNADNVA